jgi:hypothetical protein
MFTWKDSGELGTCENNKGFWMAHHERESLAGGPWHHENGEQQNVGEQNGECPRGFVEVEWKAKLVGRY